MHNAQGPTGFTLVEVMITLAVAALLATVAIPSFMTLIQTNRVVTQTNEMVSAFNLARSEAIRRGEPIYVRPNSTDDFASGWCIHTGDTCSDNTSSDNTALHEHSALAKVSVSAANAAPVRFDARGVRVEPSGSFALTVTPNNCASGAKGRARVLEIANTGRVQVSPVDC